MNRKREAAPAWPALILFDADDVENIPRFNLIDSPEYLIGRGLEANLKILQKCISRKHCSIVRDEETNLWSIISHVKNKKGVSIGGRDIGFGDKTNLKCGDRIDITPFFTFQFKCAPDLDEECCCDFSKSPKLTSLTEEKLESPSGPIIIIADDEPQDSNPVAQMPDSSMDDFYSSATPSCSKDFKTSSPVKKEIPDSNSCNPADVTMDYDDQDTRNESDMQEEIRKYKEKLSWQASKIKYLELKVKEKEKRDMELETVKEETEVLEKQNGDLKKRVADLELIELEYKTNLERFKYRDEEERTKDALQRTINQLETQIKDTKDENEQLLNNICTSADDIAKIKEEYKELEEKLKEKNSFSVTGVPAVGTNDTGNPTMPYEIIRNLLKSIPVTTDDGMILRRLVVDHGAIHAILSCLAVYSHQETGQSTDTRNQNTNTTAPAAVPLVTAKKTRGGRKTIVTNNNSKHYWAKGTGYGTGNTNATWNVDQALTKQRVEEKHVIVLLQILACYINPDFKIQNRPSVILSEIGSPDATFDSPLLPIQFVELIEQSCLIPVLGSYLRNDSVLDMARHIALYRAIMALLRTMTLDSQMIKFLLPPEYCTQPSSSTGSDPISLLNLLKQMKSCVDTYSSTLKKTNASLQDFGGYQASSSTYTSAYPSSYAQTYPGSSSYSAPYGSASYAPGYAGSSSASGYAGSSASGYAGASTTGYQDPFMLSAIYDPISYPGMVQNPSYSTSFQTTSNSAKTQEDDEELNKLISDIQDTTTIVEIIVSNFISNSRSEAIEQPQKPLATTASIEDIYIRIMKKLQFAFYDMMTEDKFNIAYHYERNLRNDQNRIYPARMKRLAKELTTLQSDSSLPCSYSTTIFVCADSDRMDVMKALIIGPAETPYANGCFEFDIYFPPEYPNVPMLINLQTTGRGSVRFNPNLYNDGKVCLSVLNTWHGRPEEKWNPITSTLWQVLISIQSLILVPDPYFNEPGYEKSRNTAAGNQSSRSYNDNIRVSAVQWAMLEQIRNPTPCFKEIIHTHFYLKRQEIIEDLKKFVNANSKSPYVVSLNKHFKALEVEFAKLQPPQGLEPEEINVLNYVPTATVTMDQPDPEPVASTSAANASVMVNPYSYQYQHQLPSTSNYYNPTPGTSTSYATSTSHYSSPLLQPPFPPQPQPQPQPQSQSQPAANFNYQNWQSLFNLPWSGSGESSGSSTSQTGSGGGLFNFF